MDRGPWYDFEAVQRAPDFWMNAAVRPEHVLARSGSIGSRESNHTEGLRE
jgi:hypothetical protein